MGSRLASDSGKVVNQTHSDGIVSQLLPAIQKQCLTAAKEVSLKLKIPSQMAHEILQFSS